MVSRHVAIKWPDGTEIEIIGFRANAVGQLVEVLRLDRRLQEVETGMAELVGKVQGLVDAAERKGQDKMPRRAGVVE